MPPNGLPPAPPVNAAGTVVDEERVFALLEQRDECRRRKDWRGADRLKEELDSVHNVVVNDRERSWSIRTVPEAPPPPAFGQFRGGVPPPAPQIAQLPRASHDYTRSSNDRHPVDTARVDTLIAARMNAKITRDFDRADALRMELRQLGVEVHDRDKLWFVDRPELAHATLTGPNGGQQGGMGGMGGMGGVMAGCGMSSGGMGGGGVIAGGMGGMGGMAAMSAPACYMGGANAPQGGAGRGMQAPMDMSKQHDYNRDPADRIYLTNEAHVHALLAERLQAKKARDFAKADAMRETLRQAGVEVFDRDKVWRALPPPDSAASGAGGPPLAAPSKNSQLHYRRAEDDHKPVDIRAVEALLDERLNCKMQRNFARADQLRDQLKQMHNVEVHDTERVWHVSRGGGGAAGFPPGSASFGLPPGGSGVIPPPYGQPLGMPPPPGARGAAAGPGARTFTVQAAGFDGDFSELRDKRSPRRGRSRSPSRSRSRSPKRRHSGFSG